MHGYHPLAEDGGLYVAGVESSLNPVLFPNDLPFVRATTHYSLFTPVLATLVRLTHIALPWLLLLADLTGIVLTLYAAWLIAAQCWPSQRTQLLATSLVAAWFTLPIAGTSLLLMDPYVTARTFSTPLSLLAIAFALQLPTRRSLTRSAITLVAAAAFHPLMAAYAVGIIIALHIAKLPTHRAQIRAYATLTTLVLAAAAFLHFTAPAESPATTAAAFSRYYWFLSQWQWFELLGIIGPLIVLTLLLRSTNPTTPQAALCRAAIAIGLIATLVSALFAHEHFPTHLVARLQPLRQFLPIYAVMIILLGGTLAELTSRKLGVLAPAFVLVMAAIMFTVQRQTFPASLHLELPHRAHANPWQQAFLWARENTPTNALFAIDANYITTANEDGQTFRATAQRSVLPDFSKDGGEAAIQPALADAWQAGATTQLNLSTLTDPARDARLLPLNATWVLLHSAAPTSHNCPYNNGTVKICTLLQGANPN